MPSIEFAISAASLIVGVVGLIAAYYWYRHSRRAKEPCYSIRNVTLVEGYSAQLTDLEVIYKGVRVENLSVARVAFWNQGAETIHQQDVADANPLRISAAPDVVILDAKLLVANNPSSQFSATVTDDGTSAPLMFDYMDQGHGVVLQVVHTGTTAQHLDIIGDIKGCKRLYSKAIGAPRYLHLPIPKSFDERFLRRLSPAARQKIVFGAAIVFFLGLMTVSIVIIVLSVVLFFQRPESRYGWGFVIASYTFMLLYIGRRMRTLSGWRLPKGLEAFTEDFFK